MSATLHDAIKFAGDADFTPDQRRSRAVAAALEVIMNRSGGDTTSIAREFQNLGTYADQIQAALKVK